jgi:hypothetical protein
MSIHDEPVKTKRWLLMIGLADVLLLVRSRSETVR